MQTWHFRRLCADHPRSTSVVTRSASSYEPMVGTRLDSLDTFFIAFEPSQDPIGNTDPDGFLSAFYAFQDDSVIQAPLSALEEVDGFTPFAIASLYRTLFGKVEPPLVEAYPLLGCTTEKPATQPEDPKASARVPPMLAVFAQREGNSVLVVGNWIPSGADQEIASGVGKKIDFTLVDHSGVALEASQSITIGIDGRGLCFAIRMPCASEAATTVNVRASWDEGALQVAADIVTAASPPGGAEQFVKQLNQCTQVLISKGEVDFVEAMKLLKSLSKPPIQNWMSTHPMRLALVKRALGTQVGTQWAKKFSIPFTLAAPAPPPPYEGPSFPLPQGQWDTFVGWSLPRSLIDAVAVLDDGSHAAIVAKWEELPFAYWLRGSRDLQTPKPLSEVLHVLRALAKKAVAGDWNVWLIWCSEA